jgi:hypothetical protein
VQTSEYKDAFSALRRIALFSLPILALLCAPIWILWRSGELLALDPQRVVQLQMAAPELVIFGPAYSNCSKRYKLAGAKAASADVLVLGTSRSMQIRAGLFLPSASFYNAGGGVSRIGHFRQFLSGLTRTEQPKLLIVSMDQWFFNARTEAYPEASFAAQTKSCSNVLNVVQSSWPSIYHDLFSSRYDVVDMPNAAYIGLNAKIQTNGFRNDGSYFYGRIINDPTNPATSEDFHFRETYRRIAERTGRFEPEQQPDPALVKELGTFLDVAKQRGIHVIGFIPPFAPSVNDLMRKTGDYRYIPKLDANLKPLFDQHGFTLLDMTDLRAIGIGDSGFIDGVHASERSHIQIVDSLLNADPALGAFTSHEHLRELLDRSPNPLALSTARIH